jgi:DEAD/DEAH box helicase domain-containing protein
MAAQYAPFPAALDPRLLRAFEARGIEQLYTHQADTIEHALAGRHVVVITPTASGKTLCYNAPVLNAILQNPSSRALYLFPTKVPRRIARRTAQHGRDAPPDWASRWVFYLRRRYAAGRAADDPSRRIFVLV